jgi:hypothetical protein
MTYPLIPSNSIIPPGLVIVSSKCKDILDDARLAITGQVLNAGKSLGLQFGAYDKVVSLYSGKPHQHKHVLARHRYCEVPPEDTEHQIIMLGSRANFNFCGDEASTTLKPMIRAAEKGKRPTAFIFSQTVSDINSLLLADTLNQYRNELIATGSTGIVMLASNGGFKDSDLPQLCEEFIEVEEAEPDFDMDCAMAFDCHSLRSLHRFGIGKTMCSTRYADHRISYSYTAFISARADERAMWWLRCAGRSYAEIGDKFGINKSTAMRQLKKLPSTTGHKVDKQWLDEMLEHLDVGADGEAINSTVNSTGDDDEDDDDYDDM